MASSYRLGIGNHQAYIRFRFRVFETIYNWVYIQICGKFKLNNGLWWSMNISLIFISFDLAMYAVVI